MPLLFLLKLLLAPLLVGAASLLGRRFGSRAIGLLASLPIVAGPILLVFALEQGPEFAARAADQTMSGVLSLGLYCLVYGRVALLLRTRAPIRVVATLLLSWLAFGACTSVLVRLPHGARLPLLAFGFGLGGLTLALAGLPRLEAPARPPAPTGPARAPHLDRDLVIRMGAAAALVMTLTEAAHRLGPSLSGLLTPFPVASTVLLVAEHAARGSEAAVLLLRGFLGGLYGFVIFCLVVSTAIVPLGIVAAFGLGLLGTVSVQIVIARAR